MPDRKTDIRDAIFDHILTDSDCKQLADWQMLGFTDDETAIDRDYLLSHDKLVLDTAFLPDVLKWQLLAALDNLDGQTKGLLINSENWQALTFLKSKFHSQVKCIYIDPPYNTGENDFPYKDSFQHSSWLSMMHDRLVHPLTGMLCPPPKRGWLWRQNKLADKDGLSFEFMEKEKLIYFGDSHEKVPQSKKFLHKVSTDVAKSVIVDNTDGEKQLANLFGQRGSFSNPKPTTLIRRFVEQTTFEGETVMDFFAGSGTTADAVLNLQYVDGKQRPYILVEMGDYFEKTLIRRVKKVVFSDKWRDGKPIGKGKSHLFQYLRLEQYEDTLNNIEFNEAEVQGSELPFLDKIRYSLDYGTRASGSLLNPDKFLRPFSYTLRVVRQNEICDDQPIDLITTFNYLLGLPSAICWPRPTPTTKTAPA